MELKKENVEIVSETKFERVESSASQEMSTTPEIMAALFLKGAIPKFQEKVKDLSEFQARRVLSAIVEYPLADKDPEFLYPIEHEVFGLGVQINNSKFILFQVALDQEKNKPQPEVTNIEGVTNDRTQEQVV